MGADERAGQRGDAGHLWARAPLFDELDEVALAAIAERLVPRAFAAGDAIIREGVWAGELFIIQSGIVQIALEADTGADRPAGGHRVPLRRLVAGDPSGRCR